MTDSFAVPRQEYLGTQGPQGDALSGSGKARRFDSVVTSTAGCYQAHESLLAVRPLVFRFRAEERLFLPPGKQENVFRGALGLALKHVCCGPDCQGTETCDSEPVCGYRRIFAPKLEGGPSGVADPPRPFVLRLGSRAEGWVERGGGLETGVNLFDADPDLVRYLVVALAQLGTAGIGPGRGRCRLHSAIQTTGEGEARLLDNGRFVAEELPPPLLVELGDESDGEGRVEVEFVTPTEIKADGVVAPRPEFRVLMARIRDRVASLMTLYQGGQPEFDFDGFLEAARRVRIVDEGLASRAVTRQSSRTGQRHSIGGAVGRIVYEGPVGRYLPWLRAAEWTGVGRLSLTATVKMVSKQAPGSRMAASVSGALASRGGSHRANAVR